MRHHFSDYTVGEGCWQLQESMGLRSAILGDADNSSNFTCERFQRLCSQVLLQMEQEEYVFSYIQAHT